MPRSSKVAVAYRHHRDDDGATLAPGGRSTAGRPAAAAAAADEPSVAAAAAVHRAVAGRRGGVPGLPAPPGALQSVDGGRRCAAKLRRTASQPDRPRVL